MQSPSLAAGTGVLQDNTVEVDDDLALDTIDEILSQHSNQKSQAYHASQTSSPAIAIASPSTALHQDQCQVNAAADLRSLTPAGPSETADVIDLAGPAQHAKPDSTSCTANLAHPRAASAVGSAGLSSPAFSPAASRKLEDCGTPQLGSANRSEAVRSLFDCAMLLYYITMDKCINRQFLTAA